MSARNEASLLEIRVLSGGEEALLANVAPTHRRRVLAKCLLRTLFDAGRALGCREAWVLTDRSNEAAMRLYAEVGGIEAPGDTIMLEFRL